MFRLPHWVTGWLSQQLASLAQRLLRQSWPGPALSRRSEQSSKQDDAEGADNQAQFYSYHAG